MTTKHIKGVGAAPGLSIGHAVWWRKVSPHVEEQSVTDTDEEIKRLAASVAEAKEQITQLRETTRKRMGEEEAGIFDAHLAFLEDPAYIGEMENRIRDVKKNATFICQQVTEELSQMMASLEDEYMKARADDIRDVGERLLLLLTGVKPFDPSLLQPGSIVVAKELVPSDTAQFPKGIAGMVTARGSKTAHAAIMARTLGIPAVLGLSDSIEEIRNGDTVIMNGHEGTITVNPSPEAEEKARLAIQQQQALREEALGKADQDAFTANGDRIQVFANIGSLKDVQTALDHKAEGVGLFRTEFLYLENDHWPTEEEQYETYKKVLDSFGDKPVVIRTLDIGGDKDLPYADLPEEENPFLGHRAIRFCLANPDIFKVQLRALLRASIHGNLWIMLPMVENVAEIRKAKDLLTQCRQELSSEGVTTGEVQIGIMVEIPAAALIADRLAKEVDFMSIGTNDLTQYTLAADRGNEHVAHLYDPVHPAVLQLVRLTCDAARKEGIVAGMCGELAGDPEMTEILIGLGLQELSMSAGTIPEVKENIRKVQSDQARIQADRVLEMESAEEVRQWVANSPTS
ncbi:phosphoenolpyruvate--protein phosphotransferase [Kroppenstedtia pulmonis]|uniref:Phosphoenolpyruvate-protein phosphotransferase n=1 Tax=Kroppenstedtia pulmonis TaxID=1380685 RepID=A0A7D4BI13_9BACL|nr:phosphoenolpyruvate--protein phosphotransferase [Kroppenstedtia pulmonis]QKG83350.1 phosphoenolpyruvate--protein phosphotransferase [Kroppenstedtia pulmonis]